MDDRIFRNGLFTTKKWMIGWLEMVYSQPKMDDRMVRNGLFTTKKWMIGYLEMVYSQPKNG